MELQLLLLHYITLFSLDSACLHKKNFEPSLILKTQCSSLSHLFMKSKLTIPTKVLHQKAIITTDRMSQLQLILFNTFNVHVQQSCCDLNI